LPSQTRGCYVDSRTPELRGCYIISRRHPATNRRSELIRHQPRTVICPVVWSAYCKVASIFIRPGQVPTTRRQRREAIEVRVPHTSPTSVMVERGGKARGRRQKRGQRGEGGREEKRTEGSQPVGEKNEKRRRGGGGGLIQGRCSWNVSEGSFTGAQHPSKASQTRARRSTSKPLP